jgi:C-terminal processing protease CtpA/Prc
MPSRATPLVRITQFQEHTGENLVNALNDPARRGDERASVDLRGNPGGL